MNYNIFIYIVLFLMNSINTYNRCMYELILHFFFSGEDLKKIPVNLNKRKEDLKRNGIYIDGKDYSVHFKGSISGNCEA